MISRNLFNSRPGSILGDPFGGGTLNSHRRSKSSTSRSSARTDTTVTTGSDSLLKFSGSYRSGSTAATSFADDESFVGRSLSRSRKLVRRGRSQSKSRSPGGGGSGSESDRASPRRGRSMSVSDGELDYSDGEGEPGMAVDPSELDLKMRLELARRNSRNQHGELVASSSEQPIEETIYEGEFGHYYSELT